MTEPTPPSASDPRAGWRGDALALAALAIAATVAWLLRVKWPIVQYGIGSGDAFGYFLPAYEYEAARLGAGALPVWNPYAGAGVPFLATLQPGALYPFRLLLLVFPPVAAMEMSAYAHMLLALGGAYLLCRRLGTSRAAAAMAGVVFVTAIVLPWLHTMSLSEPSAWLPALALGVVAVLGGGGWGWVLFLGVAGAMPVLAGGYQPTLYTAYALAIVALAAILDGWAHGRPPPARAFGRLAVAALLALATAAPQVLPTFAWSEHTMRQTRALADSQMMLLYSEAARAHRLRTFFLRWSPSDLGYFSIPVAVLVAVAMAAVRPLGLVLGAAAIVSALAILVHPDSPFFPLYRAMPGFGMFRFPTRIVLITGLCAAVAAALGLTAVTRVRALVAPRRRLVVDTLALAVAAAFLVLPYRNQTQLPWTAGARGNQLDDKFFPGTERPPADFRAYVPGGRLDLMAGGITREGMRRGVRVLQDYEPLTSRRLAVFLTAVVGQPPPAPDAFVPFTGAVLKETGIARPALLDLVAVRAILTPALSSLPVGWQLVRTSGDLGSYRNGRALPRAYVVDRARFVATEDDALATILAVDFDGHGEAVLVGVPETDDDRAVAAAARADAAPGRLVVDEPERIVVEVDRTAPGVLVVADAFAPGWVATVDGTARPLRQANYLVRGVVLRPGDRRVELRYHAPGFAPGVALAAGAWSVVVLGLVFRRRARR